MPNAAHRKPVEPEAAGSKRVYELHGAVSRNDCRKCRKFYAPVVIPPYRKRWVWDSL